jgi:hypothetical protein
MSSLLNAPEYDERRARRRTLFALLAVVIIVVVGVTAFLMRDWRYQRAVDQFFTRIEQKDYEGAYAIFNADPEWKSHPSKYSTYPFGQFSLDWGPSGEWGPITSHHVDCSGRIGSGVIVAVTVNGRPERAYIWVERKDKTLGVAPSHFQLQCGNWFAR